MAKRLIIVWAALLCLAGSAALADTVILNNGVELRNVQILEEGEYTVKVKIVDYTNVVLGKSKIKTIEREAGAAPVRPSPKEVEPSTAAEPAPPQAKGEPTSHKAYQLPTNEQGKYVEVVIDEWQDGSTEIEVKPPLGEAGEKERVYTLTTEKGEKIDVVTLLDNLGEVVAMEINPPEPPRTSPKDVFEYRFKSVDGTILRMKAKWDWNTRTLQDLQFLP